MMRYGALYRMVAVLVILSFLMVVAAPVAFAGGETGDGGDGGAGVSVPLPVPVVGPRLKPPAIPHSGVLGSSFIFNQSPKPVQLSEAAEVYKQQPYYEPGAGVMKTVTQYSNGTTLYATPMVCNNFNPAGEWAAAQKKTDVWTDWFAGWAPFAVDDGFYQAKNTTFSVERVVGPGRNYGSGHAAKIASNQPYAGGFGSPIIKVAPGAEVVVTVKYLIWDYVQAADPGKKIMDWASMGIKPDAREWGASYVNGYIRGEWAQMTHSVVAGPSGEIMVLLQGQSSGAVNSNIYFDDVQISVNGEYLADCTYEATAPAAPAPETGVGK